MVQSKQANKRPQIAKLPAVVGAFALIRFLASRKPRPFCAFRKPPNKFHTLLPTTPDIYNSSTYIYVGC